MPHTLVSFAARAREILQKENNPAGRQKVASLLSEALKDRPFVESLFDENTPERKVVYEDPQLGFCILAHRYTDAKSGPPHDHGPSWAIYGQADGETLMSDWQPAGETPPEKPVKVKQVREYKLTPGVAHVYNEGDVHAPTRTGPSRLIRIEGANMERVTRGRYEAVQG
jgi:predicted metal-dependent enzyme (double-stranded beta helix superfamily)